MRSAQLAGKVASLGAGELLVTSMDRDGTKAGYDLALVRAISDTVPVPVIASGGVGTLDHLRELARLPLDGVIVGKAIYERRFTVEEALAVLGP